MEITQYEQVINQVVVENQVVESVTDKLIKKEANKMKVVNDMIVEDNEDWE